MADDDDDDYYYHHHHHLWLCSPVPSRPRGFLITHNEASQSVGLLWMNNQLVAETST
jgi:hypothetical protein